MYCPEHLAYKGLVDRIYVWLYWRSVSTAMDLEARLQCADELESLLGRGG